MTEIAPRRSLEDLIAELATELANLSGQRPGGNLGQVRPASVEFDLPIETRVADGPAGPAVVADLPRTRTRTAYDLPLGRLTLHLVAEETP